MGKGTIISHKGDGLYELTLHKNITRYTNEVSIVTSNIVSVVERIDLLTTIIATNDLDVIQLEEEKDTAISLFTSDPSKFNKGVVTVRTIAVLQKYNESARSRGERKNLQNSILSMYARLAYLDSNKPEETEIITVWCADLTDGKSGRRILTGDVGLMEMSGSRDHGVVIFPASDINFIENAEKYNSATHGIEVPSISLGEAGLFFMTALISGLDRWQPVFSQGVISSIDYALNMAIVLVSPKEAMTNEGEPYELTCSCSYMHTGVASFLVGDAVVVWSRYNQQVNNHVIMGFVSNPTVFQSTKYAFAGHTIIQKAIDHNWYSYASTHSSLISQNAWYGVAGDVVTWTSSGRWSAENNSTGVIINGVHHGVPQGLVAGGGVRSEVIVEGEAEHLIAYIITFDVAALLTGNPLNPAADDFAMLGYTVRCFRKDITAETGFILETEYSLPFTHNIHVNCTYLFNESCTYAVRSKTYGYAGDPNIFGAISAPLYHVDIKSFDDANTFPDDTVENGYGHYSPFLLPTMRYWSWRGNLLIKDNTLQERMVTVIHQEYGDYLDALDYGVGSDLHVFMGTLNYVGTFGDFKIHGCVDRENKIAFAIEEISSGIVKYFIEDLVTAELLALAKDTVDNTNDHIFYPIY